MVALKSATQQHAIDIAVFNQKMEELEKHETELEAQECAFTCRVKQEVQCRLYVQKKM